MISMPDFDYPIFCLKKQHPDYSIDKCPSADRAALIDAFNKRTKLTWNDIKLKPRHGLGTEKIPIAAIKARIPASVPQDVTELLALRYYDLKPFLGYRDRFIFHVVFIDHKRDLYDHGS